MKSTTATIKKSIVTSNSSTATIALFVISILISLTLPINIHAQDTLQEGKAKHIVFTQPLGIFFKDFSLGYEFQSPNKLSYTLIVDYYMSQNFNNDTAHTIIDEPSLYGGLLVRPGLKFRKVSGFSQSIEGYYKHSGYDQKLVLRNDFDGETHDHYYLETRKCNSFGLSYKLGYDFNIDHFYFSPYFNIGLRFRSDYVTIHSKYEGGTLHDEYDLITDEPEYTRQNFLLPIFRPGFMVGYRF